MKSISLYLAEVNPGDVKVSGEKASFTIELTTPACPVRDQRMEEAGRAVLSLPGIKESGSFAESEE